MAGFEPGMPTDAHPKLRIGSRVIVRLRSGESAYV